MEDLHSEIVEQLEKRADAELVTQIKYYHKTSGHKCYGVRTSEIRELIRTYRPAVKQLSLEEKLELARMFFESGFDEEGVFGNMVLWHSVKEMKSENLDRLDQIADCLNNWATTNSFCIDVLQPLLLKYPQHILGLLKEWGSSEKLWKRRASVVVFTRKIGSSGDFTNEALELCDNLMWDKEDMVQKGVGWALKDVMRGDKRKVLVYIKSLRRKGVSGVITLYAIRELKGKKREEVLKIRPDVSQ